MVALPQLWGPGELLLGFRELPGVALAVIAQIMVISSSKIRQRVALVVAQHHLRLIRLDHTAYQLQRLPNLGAPVDNIAQQNHLALGMPVNTVQLAVPEDRKSTRLNSSHVA